MHRITTVEELDALYGEPVPAAVTKEIDYISDHYKAFIDKAPFVVVATVGPEGLDCSPRGDPAGFVRVAMPGLLVIGYRSNPSAIEVAADKFNQYLKEEGLDAVAANEWLAAGLILDHELIDERGITRQRIAEQVLPDA